MKKKNTEEEKDSHHSHPLMQMMSLLPKPLGANDMSNLILVDKLGAHAVLTLNRPKALNALSYELIDELMTCLDEAEADASVRTVILTGSGTKAFSAGADIVGFTPAIAASPETAYRVFVSRGQAMTRRVEAFPKPIIAAVNGLAFGGGCETIEACALAIAAEHATFAKPEIKLGFPPPFGGTQRLPRHIGRKRALEMLLTGDTISAQRALELGLINRVVDGGRLLDECLALVEDDGDFLALDHFRPGNLER